MKKIILQGIEFPIEGPIRIHLLNIEWAVIFFTLEWAVIFWFKVRSQKTQLRSLEERAYIWIFLGYALFWILSIFSDYYSYSIEQRLILLNLAYISLTICGLIAIYIVEEQVIFYKRYLFTMIYCPFLIFYLVVLFLDIYHSHYVAFAFWPLFFTFLTSYIVKVTSKSPKTRFQGKSKSEFFKFFSGFIILLSGSIFTTDFFISLFGFGIRYLGDIFQIIGMIFLSLFFMTIPTFSEYNWQEKTESLFVLTRPGICLYEKLFRHKDEQTEKNLITAGLASVNLLLKTIVDKEGTSIIKEKNKTIIIYPGTYIFGVLVCDEKLKSLQILLKTVVTKIESIYSTILSSWKGGDTRIFKPIDDIVRKVFV